MSAQEPKGQLLVQSIQTPSASASSSTMPHHDHQTAPFRFLDLPAELRNIVYKFFISTHAPRYLNGRLKKNTKNVTWGCLNYTSDKPRLLRKTDTAQPIEPVYESLILSARVCKQLRAEYLPLLMAQLHIGIAAKDLEQFLHAFCGYMGTNGFLGACFPKSLTIFMPERYKESDPLRCNKIDLLPLLKLHLQGPRFDCIFKSLPTIEKANLARRRNTRKMTYDFAPALRIQPSDIATLINCDTVKWTSLIEGENLFQVLLNPYGYCGGDFVDLVFQQQPSGVRLSGQSKMCNLPDIRRLGLEKVFRNTGLMFMGRLKAQTPFTSDQI